MNKPLFFLILLVLACSVSSFSSAEEIKFIFAGDYNHDFVNPYDPDNSNAPTDFVKGDTFQG